jgi:hypothetical protein
LSFVLVVETTIVGAHKQQSRAQTKFKFLENFVVRIKRKVKVMKTEYGFRHDPLDELEKADRMVSCLRKMVEIPFHKTSSDKSFQTFIKFLETNLNNLYVIPSKIAETNKKVAESKIKIGEKKSAVIILENKILSRRKEIEDGRWPSEQEKKSVQMKIDNLAEELAELKTKLSPYVEIFSTITPEKFSKKFSQRIAFEYYNSKCLVDTTDELHTARRTATYPTVFRVIVEKEKPYKPPQKLIQGCQKEIVERYRRLLGEKTTELEKKREELEVLQGKQQEKLEKLEKLNTNALFLLQTSSARKLFRGSSMNKQRWGSKKKKKTNKKRNNKKKKKSFFEKAKEVASKAKRLAEKGILKLSLFSLNAKIRDNKNRINVLKKTIKITKEILKTTTVDEFWKRYGNNIRRDYYNSSCRSEVPSLFTLDRCGSRCRNNTPTTKKLRACINLVLGRARTKIKRKESSVETETKSLLAYGVPIMEKKLEAQEGELEEEQKFLSKSEEQLEQLKKYDFSPHALKQQELKIQWYRVRQHSLKEELKNIRSMTDEDFYEYFQKQYGDLDFPDYIRADCKDNRWWTRLIKSASLGFVDFSHKLTKSDYLVSVFTDKYFAKYTKFTYKDRMNYVALDKEFVNIPTTSEEKYIDNHDLNTMISELMGKCDGHTAQAIFIDVRLSKENGYDLQFSKAGSPYLFHCIEHVGETGGEVVFEHDSGSKVTIYAEEAEADVYYKFDLTRNRRRRLLQSGGGGGS